MSNLALDTTVQLHGAGFVRLQIDADLDALATGERRLVLDLVAHVMARLLGDGVAVEAPPPVVELPPASGPRTSSGHQCDQCSRLFTNAQGLGSHKAKAHPKDRAHGTRSAYVGGCRCDECREAENTYQRERRSQPTAVLRPTDCPKCGQEFKTNAGMLVHHTRMHRKTAPKAPAATPVVGGTPKDAPLDLTGPLHGKPNPLASVPISRPVFDPDAARAAAAAGI